jgi:CRP/FNR family transcriptional regulator, anaerobic regulatory protein
MNLSVRAEAHQDQVAGPQPQSMRAGKGAFDIDAMREHIRVSRRKFKAGQYIYRAGQAFHSLYLVHSGILKNSELAEDGRERISGFRWRGDLVGVESIGLHSYSCDAVALEASEVWELPYPAILSASSRIPELNMCLTTALAEQIRQDRSWMLTLGTLTAKRRVAAFLLDVADRQERLGFSDRHFVLRMKRAEMSSFLALKHETVSRAMTFLDESNCISVRGREIRILDKNNLRTMAGQGVSTTH